MNGILAIGLSLLLLYLAFRKVDFETTLQLLRKVELSYVGLAILSLVLVQIVRTFRWGVLVRPFAKLSPLGLFRVANLGMALVLLLPFRLGEFARPYLLKAEAKVSMSAGFGATAVERTIDGLGVVFLYFFATLSLPEHYSISPLLRYSALVAGGLFGTALLVITLALFYHKLVVRLIERLGAPVSSKLTHICVSLVSGFVDGLKSLPSVSSVIALIAYTVVYFSLSAFSFYAVMLAFGWDLPFLCAFVLMCVVVLGIMIPAGPGFLGTYQAAIVLGLSIFGKNATEAAAYGLVIYPLSVFVVVGFGLPFMIGAQRPSLAGLFEIPSEAPAHNDPL